MCVRPLRGTSDFKVNVWGLEDACVCEACDAGVDASAHDDCYCFSPSKRIPKSAFFDINEICDKNTPLEHQAPARRDFEDGLYVYVCVYLLALVLVFSACLCVPLVWRVPFPHIHVHTQT
jgi:hypothetical protein